MGQEKGNSNMFVVKVGTNSILLDDPMAGAYQYQVQYYVILNKEYESLNQINRLKIALNQNLSPSIINQYGGYGGIQNKNIVELQQIADSLEMPKGLFTDNWRIHMFNSTRSNQKLVYPGFTTL